jgi:hypothetical protein
MLTRLEHQAPVSEPTVDEYRFDKNTRSAIKLGFFKHRPAKPARIDDRPIRFCWAQVVKTESSILRTRNNAMRSTDLSLVSRHSLAEYWGCILSAGTGRSLVWSLLAFRLKMIQVAMVTSCILRCAAAECFVLRNFKTSRSDGIILLRCCPRPSILRVNRSQ